MPGMIARLAGLSVLVASSLAIASIVLAHLDRVLVGPVLRHHASHGEREREQAARMLTEIAARG